MNDMCGNCLTYTHCTLSILECFAKGCKDYRDKEWYEAEHSGQRLSWWLYPDPYYYPEKRYVKSYTFELAKLVSKRTGCLLVSLDGKEWIENEQMKAIYRDNKKHINQTNLFFTLTGRGNYV